MGEGWRFSHLIWILIFKKFPKTWEFEKKGKRKKKKTAEPFFSFRFFGS